MKIHGNVVLRFLFLLVVGDLSILYVKVKISVVFCRVFLGGGTVKQRFEGKRSTEEEEAENLCSWSVR